MVKMGTVWDRTAEFLSDNLGTILPIALLAIFVPTSISGNFEEIRRTAGPTLTAGLGIASLLLSLVTFWGQLAIVALALDPSLERGATGVATRRLPAAIAVLLVVLAGFALLAVPVFAVLISSGYDFVAAAAGEPVMIAPAAAGIVALYMIVLLPILLIFGARFAVVTPVVVAERRGLGAIARSFRLTRGATMRIIGVLILYVVVAVVAVTASRFVFGSIFELIAGGEGVTLATVLTSIIIAAVSTGFNVVAAAFTAQLYTALEQGAAPEA